MEKENKHTEFGSKLLKRVESVRDFYHGKNDESVKVKTLRKVEFVAAKSYTAKQIKKIRETLNLTQSDLAAFLNMSVDSVRKWEQDVSAPHGAALRLLQSLEADGIPESQIAAKA